MAVVLVVSALIWLLLPSPSIARHRTAPTGTPHVVQHLAVPAYANPVTESASWARLSASQPGSVGLVVANVANGPGTHPDPAWSAVIHTAEASGGRVLGYVDTGYLGTPSLAHPYGLPTRSGAFGPRAWRSQIVADINTWYQFYGDDLGGIFLDQATSACGPTLVSSQYAAEYRSIAKSLSAAHPGALTALNPGVAVPECYRDAADVLVTFEGSYANYVASPDHQGRDYAPLSWTPKDPGQIWHIIYGAVSLKEMTHAMELSRERGAGHVYVTDAGLPNPFGSLPPAGYWSAEQAQRGR